MKVDDGKVFQTDATRCAGVTPCSLYIFRASKWSGVQINCIPMGEMSYATLSECFFYQPNEDCIAPETSGGNVKPPAIVSVSLHKKII